VFDIRANSIRGGLVTGLSQIFKLKCKLHVLLKSKRFLRRCIILCGDGFMDYIHRAKSKILKSIKKLKSHRFGSWLCFRPQVNGGVEEHLLSWAP
jgi:hypothetical protein